MRTCAPSRPAGGVKGQAASGSNREGESTEAGRRDGAARSSDEGSVMGLERRGCVVQPWPPANWKREEPVDEAKPFKIPKREVWEAFKRVKANQGAAGVDGQSIAEFEANLSGNLYKLWNRLSSGSYFPPPVRRVDIPKANGGTRPLGIPTVADRIAQEVARRYLEPILEPEFHPDSYGYRPGKSAIDAVRTARERCWRYDWVLDLDIKGFFDSIDWELMLRAVRHQSCASRCFARPSAGSRPRSAGLRLSSRLSGASAMSTRRPSDQQAVRQPLSAIKLCSQGRIVTEPTPTPENAMLSASPRRRTNQLVR